MLTAALTAEASRNKASNVLSKKNDMGFPPLLFGVELQYKFVLPLSSFVEIELASASTIPKNEMPPGVV
jgi:hypothetical protein